MCDECHQSPHATMCPNNPALAGDHPIMKKCPICEREFDEEEMDYAVCDECLKKNQTYETAIKYGAASKMSVMVNSFFWFLFDERAINRILAVAALDEKRNDAMLLTEDVPKFFNNDPSDFADWLKERKKGGG